MSSSHSFPQVTIIVKALNEERRIAACLQAALREAQSVDGEVLLVDSLSNDRTVEIAHQYPVRIVQFERVEDRGCGAAVQLGYQFSQAPYLYVLDADMVLQSGFLAEALSRLEADSGLAGVGGKLLDTRLATAYDARRAATAARLLAPLDVAELGGGGLYRRRAIESVGYLSHKGLAAYEEAELGMRLRAAGWRLLRLPQVAVSHEGHSETNWRMLKRLWRNGRAQAGGALLRSAWGQAWFPAAVSKQAHALATWGLHGGALLAGWVSHVLGWGFAAGYVAVWLAVFLALLVRKHSAAAAGLSLLLWHYSALAILPGALRPVHSPHGSIAAREIVASISGSGDQSWP